VATPGRANDLIRRKKLRLGHVERVVLDEADEMLTMGFKEELNAILAQTPQEKQTLLFSATMSKEIVAITKKYMNDPVELSAARRNTGADNVTHKYYMVHAKDRYEVLKRIADINPNVYGIVFCRTRRETKEIANKLMQDGYNADALHGDLSQAQRDEVMGRFRKRQLQMLVATDVAARGLDVSDLTHIINFDLPDDAEVYIHRSGRTGRAGKSGISIAIIHTREMRKIREIEKRFSVSFSKELVPTGKEICTKQLYALIDKMEKVEVDEKQIEPFLPAIYKKLDWLSREELIKRFVSAEFNRFLDYYKYARDINVTDGQRGDKQGRREKGSKREKSNVNYSRLYINVGSKNNLNPARLIGLINETLDSSEAEIGEIEILKKFSFFEIENKVTEPLIEGLKKQRFEGIPLLVEVSKDKPDIVSTPKIKRKGSGGRDYRVGGSTRRDKRDKWNKAGKRRSHKRF
jgi:ATP-dependent RNA helicase DeaD